VGSLFQDERVAILIRPLLLVSCANVNTDISEVSFLGLCALSVCEIESVVAVASTNTHVTPAEEGVTPNDSLHAPTSPLAVPLAELLHRNEHVVLRLTESCLGEELHTLEIARARLHTALEGAGLALLWEEDRQQAREGAGVKKGRVMFDAVNNTLAFKFELSAEYVETHNFIRPKDRNGTKLMDRYSTAGTVQHTLCTLLIRYSTAGTVQHTLCTLLIRYSTAGLSRDVRHQYWIIRAHDRLGLGRRRRNRPSCAGTHGIQYSSD
jgi:hypothetical protein